MDFRILIIKNRLKVDVDDDLQKVKDYEESRTPLRLSYSVMHTDLDLEHTSFGVRKVQDNKHVEMYGLSGVKDQLRSMTTTMLKPNIYHAVIFIYDLDDTGWFEKHAPQGHAIGHWTYFKEVYPGTEFIEVATTEGWDAIDDTVRVITHELRHAYINRVRRAGTSLVDPMDATPVEVNCDTKYPVPGGKCTEIIPYYLEYNVYHPGGNRAIANKTLDGYWEKVSRHPQATTYVSLLELLVKLMEKAIMLFKKTKETDVQIPTDPRQPEPKDLLEDWALAIKEFEGWFVGSRSYRNNNPGNLRWSKYQIGVDDGNYSIFDDYETGWKALLFQLTIAVDGRSEVYMPSDTLLQFFTKYAPSSDNNHPERYAQFVAEKLGVDMETEIRSLVDLSKIT